MLCLKNHPHMIYSLCFVFAVSFLSLFGFVSNSSATSQTITCDTLSCYNDNIRGSHDSTSVGFAFSYFSVEIHSDKVNNNTSVGTVRINGSNSTRYCPQDSSGYLYCMFHADNYTNNVAWSSWMNNDTLPWTYTVTFYDSFPLVPCDCPEPDPCPEVPENPYDDKLDKIYNAIIIGSATMLVIYFFYVMYSWYMGGRS